MSQLVTGVYGLKDAPRARRLRLNEIPKGLGGRPMWADPCLHIWYNCDCIEAVLSTHVDDIKGCGQPELVHKLLLQLESKVGKLKMQQHELVSCIRRVRVQKRSVCHRSTTSNSDRLLDIPKEASDTGMCDRNLASAYVSLLGGLGWLINMRCDIAVYTGSAQRVQSHRRSGTHRN